MKELSSATGVPSKFILEWQILVTNPLSAEQRLHKELRHFRNSKNREFFRCTPETALAYAKTCCNPLTVSGGIVPDPDIVFGHHKYEWVTALLLLPIGFVTFNYFPYLSDWPLLKILAVLSISAIISIILSSLFFLVNIFWEN